MGTWSVSTSGLNYIMEYTNGFKRSIRKNQVTKSNTSLGEEYASSQSPNLVLAYINALIQNYSFSAKFSAVSSLDLTSCFLDSINNDCATLINWGDGTIDNSLTHTYSASGDYVISVVCEDAIEIIIDKKSVSEFYYAISIGLQSLDLSENQIVDFNPSIALPIVLQSLHLNGNQIVDFNPSIALPIVLQNLGLGGNQIVDFNPSIALPIGLQNLYLGENQIVDFNPSIALPIGFQNLYLGSNQIVDFNPSIALPIGLQNLYLVSNPMTIAGYTASETWANAQPSFTSSCNVYFTNNIDSVSGTDLETILISKNCTVIV
jgi:Leucine-rich repeat (LRR) protein